MLYTYENSVTGAVSSHDRLPTYRPASCSRRLYYCSSLGGV